MGTTIETVIEEGIQGRNERCEYAGEMETGTAVVPVVDAPVGGTGESKLLEVFLCIADASRPEFTREAAKHWVSQHRVKEIELTILSPQGEWSAIMDLLPTLEESGVTMVKLGGPSAERPGGFQRDRRVWAQMLAKGLWYIVADDDCLPVGETFLDRATDLIKSHPKAQEFGVLSAWPQNAKIYPWRPPKDEYSREVVLDEQIMEHVNVGGIRFIQRMAHPKTMEEWDAQPPAHEVDGKFRYDQQHAVMLRRKGYRVGYMKDVMMVHLGERKREDDSGHPEHPGEPDFQV